MSNFSFNILVCSFPPEQCLLIGSPPSFSKISTAWRMLYRPILCKYLLWKTAFHFANALSHLRSRTEICVSPTRLNPLDLTAVRGACRQWDSISAQLFTECLWRCCYITPFTILGFIHSLLKGFLKFLKNRNDSKDLSSFIFG